MPEEAPVIRAVPWLSREPIMPLSSLAGGAPAFRRGLGR
jgi:hypothetical protein